MEWECKNTGTRVKINIMNSKDILIKVDQLYKIFGDGDKNALELVKNGMVKMNFLKNLTVFLD